MRLTMISKDLNNLKIKASNAIIWSFIVREYHKLRLQEDIKKLYAKIRTVLVQMTNISTVGLNA